MERLGEIIENDTPVIMPEGAKTILHVMPLSAFDTDAMLSLNITSNNFRYFKPLDSHPTDYGYNLEGVVIYDVGIYDAGKRETASSYLQLFRNGIMETVNYRLLQNRENDLSIINSRPFEAAVIRACDTYLQILQKKFEIGPPYLIMLSLIGVLNYYIKPGFINPSQWTESAHPIERDLLVIPEIIVDDLNNKFDVALKPIFDILWNAAGEPYSPNYGPTGRWRGI